MRSEEEYKEQYKANKTPWDIGKPDFNLIDTVKEFKIDGCKTIDLGCGTGDNSIWLNGNGFKTLSIDTSDVAIKIAEERALKKGVYCNFKNLNFLKDEIEDSPFKFAFDRGCFHSFTSGKEKGRFAKKVYDVLEKGGLWLNLSGNADEKRETPGPVQISAMDILTACEPYFEILMLKSTNFGSTVSNPPRAFKCLMKKRSH